MSVNVKNYSPIRAYLYASIAIGFWSVGAYLFCTVDHVPLFQVLAIAQLVGAIVSLFFHRPKKPLTQVRRSWPFTLLILLNQIAYVVAFRMAPAAHVDLINYLWPCLLVVGQALYTRKGLHSGQLLGLALCVVALFVLLWPALETVGGIASFGLGYIAAIVAAFTWALYSLLKKNQKGRTNECTTATDLLLSAMACVAIQLCCGGFVAMSLVDTCLIILIGIGSYGLAFPCWQRALRTGSCASVGGLANLIPVLSVAWLVVGGISPLTLSLFFAGLLIVGGCMLLNKSEALSFAFSRKIYRQVTYASATAAVFMVGLCSGLTVGPVDQ